MRRTETGQSTSVFHTQPGSHLRPSRARRPQAQYNVINGIYTFAAADARLGVLISYSDVPGRYRACVHRNVRGALQVQRQDRHGIQKHRGTGDRLVQPEGYFGLPTHTAAAVSPGRAGLVQAVDELCDQSGGCKDSRGDVFHCFSGILQAFGGKLQHARLSLALGFRRLRGGFLESVRYRLSLVGVRSFDRLKISFNFSTRRSITAFSVGSSPCEELIV